MTSGAAVERVTAGRGDDPASTVVPSAAALAAQALLQARRAAAGIAPRLPAAGLDHDQAAASRGRPTAADHAQKALEARRLEVGVNYRRPTVEGGAWSAWASTRAGDDLDGAAVAGIVGAQTPDPAADGGRVEALAGDMATVHPSLAAAFLASKWSAVGRLWLLLRAWDTAGRGCYSLDQVHEAFSVEGSAWHIGGRRRVQQLIRAGAGTFWTLRDYHGGRWHGLQMTGPAGVAVGLGLGHLAGRPARVPVADLLGGMHRANAALYGVTVTLRDTRRGGHRPVTRRTLAGVTGRAPSTQRTYSKTARIEARPNYVLLPSGDVDGPGVFLLHDYLGQQGRAGRVHLARRMPNSYVVPLAAASRGRQRKINRRLNLVLSEARGYWPEVDYRRIYHDTATGAARAYGRNYHDDHYWIVGRTAAGAGLWHMVEGVSL